MKIVFSSNHCPAFSAFTFVSSFSPIVHHFFIGFSPTFLPTTACRRFEIFKDRVVFLRFGARFFQYFPRLVITTQQQSENVIDAGENIGFVRCPVGHHHRLSFDTYPRVTISELYFITRLATVSHRLACARLNVLFRAFHLHHSWVYVVMRRINTLCAFAYAITYGGAEKSSARVGPTKYRFAWACARSARFQNRYLTLSRSPRMKLGNSPRTEVLLYDTTRMINPSLYYTTL